MSENTFNYCFFASPSSDSNILIQILFNKLKILKRF